MGRKRVSKTYWVSIDNEDYYEIKRVAFYNKSLLSASEMRCDLSNHLAIPCSRIRVTTTRPWRISIMEKAMKLPKLIKILILIFYIPLIMPLLVLWQFLCQMVPLLKELIYALGKVPKDCYAFVKYQSIHEYNRAKYEEEI